MNKKLIIMPIAITALGVTACNGNVFNPKLAANAAYEAAVATAKDLDSFLIDADISSSKIDMSYSHEHLNRKKETDNIRDSYDIKLNDFSVNAYTKIGGLKKYDEYYTNKDFKAHLGLFGLTTKGEVKYTGDRKKGDQITADVNFDKVGTIENLSAYIDRNIVKNEEEDYGLYFNFGTSNLNLEKIDFKLNSLYDSFDTNIQKKVTKLKDMIADGEKRYISIADLSKKSKVVEYIFELGLGMVGSLLDEFTQHTEEEKAEVIQTIENTMTEMNKTEAGQILSMGYDNTGKLHFDINLDSNKLNKITETNCFSSGTVKATVSADENKRIGSFSAEVKDLKTSEPFVFNVDESTGSSKKVMINDFDLKIDGVVDYDVYYALFAEDVHKITSDEAFKKLEF